MTRDEWKSHIAKRIGTLPHVVEWYIPKALDALADTEAQRIAAVTEWAEAVAELEVQWHRAEWTEELLAMERDHTADLQEQNDELRREIAFLKLGALLQSTMTKESK